MTSHIKAAGEAAWEADRIYRAAAWGHLSETATRETVARIRALRDVAAAHEAAARAGADRAATEESGDDQLDFAMLRGGA